MTVLNLFQIIWARTNYFYIKIAEDCGKFVSSRFESSTTLFVDM